MAEWTAFADQYLELAERAVLSHAGSVSHDQMLKIVDQRYTTFDKARRESERRAAELIHEQEVESELRLIENKAIKGKRISAPKKPKGNGG